MKGCLLINKMQSQILNPLSVLFECIILNPLTAMAKWLRRWIPNPGVPCSKPLGGSKVDSVFHPSEVDKMSTRNFWELSGKK